jgi:phage/plasmid primase-like uncharacterized protein
MLAHDGRVVWECFNEPGLRDADVRSYLGICDDRDARPATCREREEMQRRRKQAVHEDRRRKAIFCRDVWSQRVPLLGTPAEVYLGSRGLSSAGAADLAFHPTAPRAYRGADTSPAMMALVRDNEGLPTGLHVTALKADGSGKAFGDRSRVMFGAIAGSAVRLAPLGLRGELAIAEGIETALSFAALDETPTWALLSTANFKTFQVPSGVRLLTIAADGDEAGRVAAEGLAARARKRCDVIVAAPSAGLDWNDILQRGGA